MRTYPLRFPLLILVNISVLIVGVCAQQVRVPGLSNDPRYIEVIGRQKAFKAQEDSILTLIGDQRKQFEASAETEDIREKIAREIVRLEGDLFEIRNKMGRTTAQLSALEQDYILSQMNKPAGQGSAPSGTSSDSLAPVQPIQSLKQERTLFTNAFFRENLSASDITLFSLTPRVEPEVVKIDHRVHDFYEQLKTLKRQYDAATDQESIDSLLVRAVALKEQIEQADALMEQLWLVVYTRKMDNYPVLMDKIQGIDRLALEQLDQDGRQLRRTEGLAAEQLAPLISTFPLQKRLALDYEITMATALKLTLAHDSLTAERKKIPIDTAMTYPDIPFAPKSLVVYGPILQENPNNPPTEAERYFAVSDIPEFHVPRQGIYYTVQVTAFNTPPKSIDIFKGVTPLRWQKLSSGATRYLAGGFHAYAQGQEALNQMVRAGFKAPALLAWVDGKVSTPIKAKTLEASQTTTRTPVSGQCSVEITPAEGRLSTALRDIINQYTGENATVVRSTRGTQVVYTVGGLKTRVDAEKLVETLRARQNVAVEVVESL